jgi:Flp pilus assembly protein TadG
MIARSLHHKLSRLIARFRRNERGVAAVEFALVVPFLLTLYLGSIEAAAMFTVDKRVNSISATIGDLVGQWDPGDGDLPTDAMNDYLSAATGIMAPYSTVGLKIVVTLVQVHDDGTTEVLWSQANAAGTPKTVGNSYEGLTADSMINQVSQGGCIIAAESSYAYLPILGQVFNTPLTLSHTNYFVPRFGSSDAINLESTDIDSDACTAA